MQLFRAIKLDWVGLERPERRYCGLGIPEVATVVCLFLKKSHLYLGHCTLVFSF